MEKLYVNEIRAGGEVSTVGLFYSRGEADNVIAQLRNIPEKATCLYEIIQAVADSSPSHPAMQTRESGKE